MTTKTWRERVAEAKVSGYFTKEDKLLANSWDTCAIGEQRELYPDVVLSLNLNHHIPADDILYILGQVSSGFCFAIYRQNIKLASDLLDKIEDRVLELKREKET